MSIAVNDFDKRVLVVTELFTICINDFETYNWVLVVTEVVSRTQSN